MNRGWPGPVRLDGAHRRKIWSTNPLERVNKEIKRRSRVVGISPDEAAVIRLVGGVLADAVRRARDVIAFGDA